MQLHVILIFFQNYRNNSPDVLRWMRQKKCSTEWYTVSLSRTHTRSHIKMSFNIRKMYIVYCYNSNTHAPTWSLSQFPPHTQRFTLGLGLLYWHFLLYAINERQLVIKMIILLKCIAKAFFSFFTSPVYRPILDHSVEKRGNFWFLNVLRDFTFLNH